MHWGGCSQCLAANTHRGPLSPGQPLPPILAAVTPGPSPQSHVIDPSLNLPLHFRPDSCLLTGQKVSLPPTPRCLARGSRPSVQSPRHPPGSCSLGFWEGRGLQPWWLRAGALSHWLWDRVVSPTPHGLPPAPCLFLGSGPFAGHMGRLPFRISVLVLPLLHHSPAVLSSSGCLFLC